MHLERAGAAAACIFAAVASFIPATPTYAQSTLPRLQPVTRIGCLECVGPAAFGDVQHVSLAADGRIVVLDRDAPVVRVFRTDGTAVVAFGRAGGGPGEVRLAIAAHAHADGIDLIDMRQLRVTRYSPAGQAVRQSTLTDFPIAARYDAARARWILMTTDFRNPVRLSTIVPGDSAARPLIAFAADFPRDRSDAPSHQPAFAVAPDGSIAAGDGSGAYRLRRYSPEGRVVGEISRDVARGRKSAEQIRLEQERITTAAARMAERLSREGGRAGVPAPTVPVERDFFNAYSLAFDPHGRLWVRTPRAAVGETVFDIFSADGSYLGELRVDAEIGIFALNAGYLVGLVRGPADVPLIAVWRLREER